MKGESWRKIEEWCRGSIAVVPLSSRRHIHLDSFFRRRGASCCCNLRLNCQSTGYYFPVSPGVPGGNVKGVERRTEGGEGEKSGPWDRRVARFFAIVNPFFLSLSLSCGCTSKGENVATKANVNNEIADTYSTGANFSRIYLPVIKSQWEF